MFSLRTGFDTKNSLTTIVFLPSILTVAYSGINSGDGRSIMVVMSKIISLNKLPKRPVVLCTWFEGGKWHKYERVSLKETDEEALEETRQNVLWSKLETFEMQIVDYR